MQFFFILYEAIVLLVASTHVLNSLSHNLRSNLRGHLKLILKKTHIILTSQMFIHNNLDLRLLRLFEVNQCYRTIQEYF